MLERQMPLDRMSKLWHPILVRIRISYPMQKAFSFAERIRILPDISPFIFADEIDAITRVHDVTRKRMERRGLFPRRIHIAPRRIAWRRPDIEAWAADPEGWAKRQPAERA